eukprot:scaffold100131_cov54-Phaeocystis_antarctica.AAC.1
MQDNDKRVCVLVGCGSSDGDACGHLMCGVLGLWSACLGSGPYTKGPVMNRCQLMSLSCDMLILSTQGLELA